MTIKELILELNRLDPSLLVVMSIDQEGNGFKPVREISDDNNVYDDGDLGIHHLTRVLESQRFTDEDIMQDGERCIVIWP